jgi:RHS repeat-associated protein
MNKYTLKAAIAFFALALFAGAVLSPVLAEEANLFSFPTGSPPRIDGVEDPCWNSFGWNSISHIAHGRTDSTADLSAAFKAGYESETIYALIRVHDEELYGLAHSGYYLDNDSVSLFMDEGLGNRFQASVSYGSPMVVDGEGNPIAGVSVAWHATSDGYDIEISVPLSVASLAPPGSGQRLGFDILINDCDGAGSRECMLFWSGDEGDITGTTNLGGLVASSPVFYTIEAESGFGQGFDVRTLQGISFVKTAKADTGSWTLPSVVLDPGSYYLWLKARADDSASASIAVAFDSTDLNAATRVRLAPTGEYRWVRVPGTALIARWSTSHTVTLFGMGRFAEVDKLLLTNDPGFIPEDLERPILERVQASRNGVTLRWKPYSASVEMSIERKQPHDTAFFEIARIPASQASYIDRSSYLVDGITYRIKAISSRDSSPYSKAEMLRVFLPEAPQSPSLSVVDGDTVVKWSSDGANIHQFSIEARFDDGEYIPIGVVSSHERSFRHWGSKLLSPSVKVRYRLRAVGTMGYSPYAYVTSSRDLVAGLEYSDGSSDWYLLDSVKLRTYDDQRHGLWYGMYSDSIFQDLKKDPVQNRFSSLPAYLKGLSFLRAISTSASCEDRPYLSFVARENLKLYLLVTADSDVNLDQWVLKEQAVSINPVHYPQGVDVYVRTVVKGEKVTITGNRDMCPDGGAFLVFMERDPSASIAVNFCPSTTKPVDGYLRDCGAVFGFKEGGLSYGWARDASAYAKNFGSDPLQSTFIEVPADNHWKIELPQGLYHFALTVGDPLRYYPEDVIIDGKGYSFFEEPFVLREDKRSLTIEGYFQSSYSNGYALRIDRGRLAAKLKYIRIEKVATLVDRYSAVSDTYITNGFGSKKTYGAENYICSGVSGHGFADTIGVIQFTVPRYSESQGAYLSLYLRDRDPTRVKLSSIKLYAIDGYSFDEHTLTWDKSGLVVKSRGKDQLASSATYLGEALIDAEDSCYRFDVSTFMATRTSENVSFLILCEDDRNASIVFYSKEYGPNPPTLEILSRKEGISLTGTLRSQGPGVFLLRTAGFEEYRLSDELVALDRFVGLNLQIHGYFDPNPTHVVDGTRRIIVESATVIPPLEPVSLSAPSWDNTGLPVWSWNAPEGATLYRYSLDYTAWTETTQTSFVPASPLGEGSHSLEVACRNALSDWTASVSATVKVDLSAPQIYDMTYPTPTNVRTPSFTWKAKDNFSLPQEIFFEYRIDQGAWKLSMRESYTIEEPLDEGIHTFEIRARDLAGNWSESALYPIEIDLTPPADPTDVQVRFEGGKARVTWIDSITYDAASYVVTRIPSMPEPVVVAKGIQYFIDPTSADRSEKVQYYKISTVDRAGNTSGGAIAADGSQTMIDPAVQEVQVAGDQEVCAVFAPGTVAEPITVITRKIDPPIVSRPGMRQISSVYNFSPEGTEFLAPVMIRFTYNPADLDDPEEASRLRIVYFDPAKLSWVKLPTIVDQGAHQVITFTSHFSQYSLMVDSSDAFAGEGVDPFTLYEKNMSEVLSEQDGNLFMSYTLATVPEAMGNDLKLGLVYSAADTISVAQSVASRTYSKAMKALKTAYDREEPTDGDIQNATLVVEAPPIDPKGFYFGAGWSLDIPHIVNTTVYMPGGSAYGLFLGEDVHSGIHFTSSREGNDIKLVFPTGYTFVFDGTSYFAPNSAKDESDFWVQKYFDALREFNNKNTVTMGDLQELYSSAFCSWTKTNGEWDQTPTNRIARLTKIIDSYGNTVTYSYSGGTVNGKPDRLTISKGSDAIVFDFTTMRVSVNGVEDLVQIESVDGRITRIKQAVAPGSFLTTSFEYTAHTALGFSIPYYLPSEKYETEHKQNRAVSTALVSKVTYPSNAHTEYAGSLHGDPENFAWRYCYSSQKTYDRDGNLTKDVQLLIDGGARQTAGSSYIMKDKNGVVVQERTRYYDLFGHLSYEYEAGKETSYEYYFSPGPEEEVGFKIKDLKIESEITYFGINNGKDNVFKKPGSGISVESKGGRVRIILGSGEKDIALYLEKEGDGKARLVAAHDGKEFMSFNNATIRRSEAGIISKDPLTSLFEYKGNQIYLRITGYNEFSLIYSKLSEADRGKRNRVKRIRVVDTGELEYSMSYDYDTWGNAIYEKQADGHQIFRRFSDRYLNEPLEEAESLNTGISYSSLEELLAAGNYRRTQWVYSTHRQPDAVLQSDGNETRTTTTSYYPDGNLKSILKPGNQETDFTYNEKGLRSSVTVKGLAPYSVDLTTYYVYDELNRLKTERIGERSTSYTYDLLGRKTAILYPDGSTKVQYYDDAACSATVATVKRGMTANLSELTADGLAKTQADSSLVDKIRYYYDGLGHMSKLVTYMHANAQPYYVVNRFYDPRGLLVRTEDSCGRTTERSYDLRGNLTYLLREDGSSISIEHSYQDLLDIYTDEEGFRTKVKHDLAGRTASIAIERDRGGAYYVGTCFEYNGVGDASKIINGILFDADGTPLGAGIPGESEIYQAVHNGFGELIKSISPDYETLDPQTGASLGVRPIVSESKISFAEGAAILAKRAPSQVQKNANYWETTYTDAAGHNVKTISPTGALSSEYYDAYGQVVSRVDPEGNVSRYIYDSMGRVSKEIDADGKYVGYEYDERGKLIQKTWGEYSSSQGVENFTISYSEHYKYDSLGRLVQTSYPDGTSERATGIDVYGNVTTMVDRGGRATTMTYDMRNRLISTTAPSGSTITKTYDKRGLLISEKDQRGVGSTYVYNGVRQLVRYDSPSGMRIDFEYDRAGRKITRTEGTTDGRETKSITTWTYIPGTTLIADTTVFGDGKTETLQTLTYDADGNVIVDDRNGVVRKYRYDQDGRLVQELDSATPELTITYDYYPDGQLKQKTERSGIRVVMSYSPANRLTSVDYHSPGGTIAKETVRYTYDALGRVSSTSRNGADAYEREYVYDPLTGRLLSERLDVQGKSYSTGYAYASGGELTGIAYPGSTATLSYSYDQYGRLRSVGGVTDAEGFEYDDRDLVTTTSFMGGSKIAFGYDEAHRLATVTFTAHEGEDPAWALSNQIDAYGDIRRQTMTGTYLQTQYGIPEHALTYEYDFRHRLAGYATEYLNDYTLAARPSKTEVLSRDFDSKSDYDAEFYRDLASDPNTPIDHKPGMDYLESDGQKLIGYYPDIFSSDDPATATKRFALDSEGRSVIIDLGKTIDGISCLRLLPSLYSQDEGSVTEAKNRSKLLDRLDEYNLCVKVEQDGHYVTIPSLQTAKEGDAVTWSIDAAERSAGILALRFSSPIHGNKLKLYCLIDERSPVLSANVGEDRNLLPYLVARESEAYFENKGAFISEARYVAEVEYLIQSRMAEHYTYDANGNRLSRSTRYYESPGDSKDAHYTYYPNSNRLMSDGTYFYHYDADGNLIRKYNDELEYTYSWNLQGRLEKVTLKQYSRGWKDEWAQQLSEDELDQLLTIFEAKYEENGTRYWKRTRRTDGSYAETRYVYSSVGLLYEETTSSTGSTARSYIYAGGMKLAQVEGNLDVAQKDGSGKVQSFPLGTILNIVSDQLGSTRILASPSGTIEWYGEYTPFGSMLGRRGNAGITTSQTFTSYTEDIEVGLDYAMARYYDPDLGRFITEDPAHDGQNWYVYAGDNPLTFTDPTGLIVVSTGDGRFVTINNPGDKPDVSHYWYEDDKTRQAGLLLFAEMLGDKKISYNTLRDKYPDVYNALRLAHEEYANFVDDSEIIKDIRMSRIVYGISAQGLGEDANDLTMDDFIIAVLREQTRLSEIDQVEIAVSTLSAFPAPKAISILLAIADGTCGQLKGNNVGALQTALSLILPEIPKVARNLSKGFKSLLAEKRSELLEAGRMAGHAGDAAGAGKTSWQQYEFKYGGQQTKMTTTFNGQTINVRLDKPPTGSTIIDFKNYDWSKSAYNTPFIQDKVIQSFTTQIQKYQTIAPNVHFQFSQSPPSWVVNAIQSVGGTFSVAP